MVLIIPICRLFILIPLVVIGFTNSLATDLKLNQYGNYLSWEYAKNSSDLKKLKKYFKNVNLDNLDESSLEEIFFESVILDDWSNANKISSIILEKDKNNFSANLFKFFEGFIKGENSDYFLERVDLKYFDLNFIKSMIIWKNFQTYEISEENKDCVPIVCLHSAVFLIIKGESQKAQFFFDKIKDEKLSSYRVKEILLLNSINSKIALAGEHLLELSEYDLNIKNLDINYISNNKHLLNPIENKEHGMAEVLYNISSWYYSKSLYKYAAFFGNISLKIRPNFNAMRLLLSGIYDRLGYEDLNIKFVSNLNHENLYFYKFLRIKLSLFDGQNRDEEFLSNLQKFTKEYPERIEMKILLADKLRRMEKYLQAIDLYSEIILNKDYSRNWNIFYSRGISYERINMWEKAEKDLKEALRQNPGDAYVLNYLAYSWLDRKINIQEALELLKKAVELEPSDAYIIDSLGWAFYLTDETDKSIYFLEKALSILPDDATLNDHLGDAYWKAGRKEEALSQWKRVLLFDPNFKKKKLIEIKIKEGL